MKIHILRVIIVGALLEAPFVCGGRGDRAVCDPISKMYFIDFIMFDKPHVSLFFIFFHTSLCYQQEDPGKAGHPSYLSGSRALRTLI